MDGHDPEVLPSIADWRLALIAFDKVGSGNPLVFLHSGLADRTMWQPQLPTLAARYTCYVIDLPGYGESSSPTEPFSYPVEIARFIEDSVGERTALVGSSFGATQAFLTALAAPQWVGPLVLANTAVMRPEPASPELAAVWTEADAAWDRGEHDRANEIEIEGWVDGKGRRDGLAAPHVRDYFAAVNRSIWERHSANPLPDELPRPEIEPEHITQPVLLIDGPNDFPDVRQSNKTLLERLPDAQYVSIADTAHFPSYEQPALFNRIALEFLDRNWGAKAA
jgi:pimeloyl-ACP methyl ester carboxylesterase